MARHCRAIFGRALPPLALPGILLGHDLFRRHHADRGRRDRRAAYALMLAFVVYRTLQPAQLAGVIGETVQPTAMIALIMAGAFVFNYAVANENVPQLIRDDAARLESVARRASCLTSNLLMLLLAIVLDEVTILLVIVPLLVPVAQGLGIDLVHFGVVVVLNMMVGLTLPPHGLLLFVMSGLTGTPLGGDLPRGAALHRDADRRVACGDCAAGHRTDAAATDGIWRLERYRADCHCEARSDEAIFVGIVRAQLDGDCRVAPLPRNDI